MSKALSITAILVLTFAAATAAAQPARSPVERLKLQEQATGVAERGSMGDGSSTSRLETAPAAAASPIVAQERGRATDPRLLGPQLPAPVVVIERRGGFHWVDAGAGAGAALALASLVAAAAGLRRRAGRVQPGEGRA